MALDEGIQILPRSPSRHVKKATGSETFRKTAVASVEPRTTTAALERAYAGYAAEVRFSEVGLAAFLLRHDIDTGRSPLWFSGDEPVAIALLGLREEDAWIGAFGVASSFRGRGLSHGFFEEVMAEARTAGVSHIELEVLEENLAARAVYERAGFLATREIKVLERAGRATASAESALVPAHELATRIIEPPGTTWQNRIRTILRLENLLACVAGVPQRPDAFVFFARYDDRLVLYLADGQPGALGTLIDGIARPYERMLAHNIRRGSACDVALEAIGFETIHTGLVMERTL